MLKFPLCKGLSCHGITKYVGKHVGSDKQPCRRIQCLSLLKTQFLGAIPVVLLFDTSKGTKVPAIII